MNIFKIFLIASFLSLSLWAQESVVITDKTKEIVVNKLSDIEKIEKEKALAQKKQEELERLKRGRRKKEN